MIKYHLDKLSNQVRVLYAPMHETEAVTVMVLVKVGSRYEPLKVNGISHFIEHLLFKGTAKRPTSLDITKELDGVGADYNAFTGKDHTGYYIKVNHDKLELAMDIVSDMLFNSIFSPEEITKERGVIMEEINMYEDNPMMLIDSLLEEELFKGNPLARKISGEKENIQAITRKQILDYFHENYVSNNVIVGLSGKFNVNQAGKLVKKYFGKNSYKIKHNKFIPFKDTQKQSRVRLKTKETEQINLAIGFPSYSMTDPKVYPLSLLSIILGGNMSSRLFMEIREKLGLAYFIRSSVSTAEDCGNFAVYAGLEKSKIKLAVQTIIKELNKTVNQKVTAEELNRAKEFLKGKMILRLEDSAQVIEWLTSQQLLKNKIENLEEQMKKIDQVNLNQIQQVAREIIKPAKINLAVIGPYKNSKAFYDFMKN
jgi:predicted Zn-dependent peptidase